MSKESKRKLTITRENKASEILLLLEGELSIYTVKHIKEELLKVISEGKTIILDVAASIRIDTSVYQLLLAARKELNNKGVDIKIVNPGNEAAKMFDLYKFPLERNA